MEGQLSGKMGPASELFLPPVSHLVQELGSGLGGREHGRQGPGVCGGPDGREHCP